MLVHGLPDPQGFKGNKMRLHSVEERRAVDGWLHPSLVKLELTNHRGERIQGEQKHRAGKKESFLVLYFLSFNPLSHAWDLMSEQVGLNVEGEMMLPLLQSDLHAGPRIGIAASSVTLTNFLISGRFI